MKRMKRILSVGLFLLFVTVIFLSGVKAKEEVKNEKSLEASASTEAAKSEYLLPYTGILPDHSLYKLKVLRDKIVLFLIRDPFKRAEKHLQMADKEFLMALKLAEKNNTTLGLHTAFKAEHHMTLFNTDIKNGVYYANKQIDLNLVDKANRAALKHQEIMAGIMAKLNEQEKESLKTIQQFSMSNDQSLSEFAEEESPETSEEE